MNTLTFLNLDINSLVDLQNNPLDEASVTYKVLPNGFEDSGLAFDSALYDVVFTLLSGVSSSLLAHWIIQQVEARNIAFSFKINNRSLSEQELKDPALLKRVLDEELEKNTNKDQ
jgi:hypothetical protein